MRKYNRTSARRHAQIMLEELLNRLPSHPADRVDILSLLRTEIADEYAHAREEARVQQAREINKSGH